MPGLWVWRTQGVLVFFIIGLWALELQSGLALCGLGDCLLFVGPLFRNPNSMENVPLDQGPFVWQPVFLFFLVKAKTPKGIVSFDLSHQSQVTCVVMVTVINRWLMYETLAVWLGSGIKTTRLCTAFNFFEITCLSDNWPSFQWGSFLDYLGFGRMA